MRKIVALATAFLLCAGIAMAQTSGGSTGSQDTQGMASKGPKHKGKSGDKGGTKSKKGGADDSGSKTTPPDKSKKPAPKQ